jgi:hypothetical protein
MQTNIFIGNIDLPESEKFPENVIANTRQGVAVEYVVSAAG